MDRLIFWIRAQKRKEIIKYPFLLRKHQEVSQRDSGTVQQQSFWTFQLDHRYSVSFASIIFKFMFPSHWITKRTRGRKSLLRARYLLIRRCSSPQRAKAGCYGAHRGCRPQFKKSNSGSCCEFWETL